MKLHDRQLRDIYVDLLIEAAKKHPNLVIVERRSRVKQHGETAIHAHLHTVCYTPLF
ncbi:MAG: hypothetical protein FD133_1268 [Erysipelotrichaceae bacterium]|nr:MAG: hypothetical protein FD133_1268 [Erysipelotrichaceae bacterium]